MQPFGYGPSSATDIAGIAAAVSAAVWSAQDRELTIDPSITVAPLQATYSHNKVATRDFTLYQGGTETFTWVITDANGDPVDLSSKAVRLVLATDDGNSLTGVAQYDKPAGLTVGGADGNNVSRTFSTSDTGAVRTMKYLLWNQTDGDPMAEGTIRVRPALRSVS
jgi:hypothetical protein